MPPPSHGGCTTWDYSLHFASHRLRQSVAPSDATCSSVRCNVLLRPMQRALPTDATCSSGPKIMRESRKREPMGGRSEFFEFWRMLILRTLPCVSQARKAFLAPKNGILGPFEACLILDRTTDDFPKFEQRRGRAFPFRPSKERLFSSPYGIFRVQNLCV